MTESLFLPFLFAMLLIGAILSGCQSQSELHLMAYVGSGMKKPMLEIKRLYEARHPHIVIDYSFSGSKVLEQTVRSLKQGDAIMVGDKKHVEALEQDGLIIAQYPVALHIPAVLTLKENTIINRWEDLVQENVKLCIPNPNMASIGRIAEVILQRSPLASQIKARVTSLTVNTDESIKLLLDHQVDAVISWASMLEVAPDKLKMIEIPKEINEITQIWVAVPSFTHRPTEATAFVKFVVSVEGLAIFQKMGFLLLK